MSNEIYSKLQHCLDSYMELRGKKEIDEMEANSELARQGLLEDDQAHPGRPLRELLSRLRDSNMLPRNVKQVFGAWKIKHSRALQMRQQIFMF
jgi:hypothetical protein